MALSARFSCVLPPWDFIVAEAWEASYPKTPQHSNLTFQRKERAAADFTEVGLTLQKPKLLAQKRGAVTQDEDL